MDDQPLEFFAWEARCWVCVGSNFSPKVHIAIYKACVLEGDYTKGRRIMSAMLPLMRVLEQGGKFVQSVKYRCELTSLRPRPQRLPLQPLTSKEMSELEKVISNLETEISKIIVDG
jgi:4-hydroxy-tetrahydrodipicolinate synthase